MGLSGDRNRGDLRHREPLEIGPPVEWNHAGGLGSPEPNRFGYGDSHAVPQDGRRELDVNGSPQAISPVAHGRSG